MHHITVFPGQRRGEMPKEDAMANTTTQEPRIQLGDPEPRTSRRRGLKLPQQRVPVDQQLLLEQEQEQLTRRLRQRATMHHQ
jgi:hypothetical protein